jgi:hypothetical protein
MNRLIALSFVLVLFSCEDAEIGPVFADDPSIRSIEGTWQVEYFYDLSAKERIEKSKDNSWGYDIEITFQENTIDTTFAGSNTTNQIAGQYAYRGERTIEILNLSSTFVNQPEWANLFVDAILDDTVRFAADRETLRFYYEDDSRYVSLKRIH